MNPAANNPLLPANGLQRMSQFADVGLALGVVGVIVVLVLPLPTAILDIMLCCQFALSLAILLGGLYCNEPLEFAGFPSLLLFVTLARLSLNVASARLILLNGDAGHVIRAFGDFVVGGSYVVGLIVFLILCVINFVVITKGAGRVAEVAARFALDAMPGKQMAIDADLNAGLIDEQEARKRRKKVERESSFFGAMDGASKFVRGDAIASLLICGINIVGGLGIGVLQKGMGIQEALQHYTLLTIGEGLVSSIPALLVSTATGLVVTRGSSDQNLGTDITRQMLSKARPLQICAAFLAFFALVPGLPTVPFAVLAAGCFFLSRIISKNMAARNMDADVAASTGTGKKGGKNADKNAAAPAAGALPEGVENLLKMDPLELELGAALVSLADTRNGGEILNRISQTRKKMAGELGVVVPPVRVRDNLQLPTRRYRLRLRGAAVGEGEIFPERFMAIDPGGARPGLQGTKTQDPAFGLPALWIGPELRGRAEALGYTVVDAVTVLCTHLHEMLKANASELLSRQDVHLMVERLKTTDPAVVKDVVPNQVGLPLLHRVLQGLLKERIPIRDLSSILETLADFAGKPERIETLVEKVRIPLAPAYVRSLEDPNGGLGSVALDPNLESRLSKALVMTEQGQVLVLTPLQVPRLLKAIEDRQNEAAKKHKNVVLICSAGLRPHLRRLVERILPKLPVLSYLEIPRGTQLEIVSQVSANVLGEEGAGLFGANQNQAMATK